MRRIYDEFIIYLILLSLNCGMADSLADSSNSSVCDSGFCHAAS